MTSYVEKNRGFITCSKLKQYKKSKEAFKKIYIDEIDTSIIPTSTALEKGSMVDSYILTPEQFDNEYAFKPGAGRKADLIAACNQRSIPVEKSARVADLEAKLFGNRTVITPAEEEMLKGIKRELQRQPLYDFDGDYECQKGLIVEYKGHKLKGTLDRLSVEKGLIRDLKTVGRDLEFSSYHDMTRFEDKLIHNDEFQYGLQLARYRVLCKINYGKEMSGIIDAIKPSGNFAFESYIFTNATLKMIANEVLFPALDALIQDIDNDSRDDYEDVRNQLINDRYYPLLDGSIQTSFREVVPALH